MISLMNSPLNHQSSPFINLRILGIPRVFKEKDNYNKIIENINENLKIDHYKAIIKEYQIKLDDLTLEYCPTDDNRNDIFRSKIPDGMKIFDMFNNTK